MSGRAVLGAFLVLFALVLLGQGFLWWQHRPQPGDGLFAVIHTDKGPITVELAFNRTPLTVANFVGLAEGALPPGSDGTAFYDGLTFHRVVPGFVVQGGDPAGDGSGGPGYQFGDEFHPTLRHDRIGTLAMANAGPATNGSQFYLTLDATERLNYMHTVFGHVVDGIEVLPQLAQGDTIQRVEIIRKGTPAEAFQPTAESFARLRVSVPTPPVETPEATYFVNLAGEELPGWLGPWLNRKLFNYAWTNERVVQAGFVAGETMFPAPPEGSPPPVRLLFDTNAQQWRVSGLQHYPGLENRVADLPDELAALAAETNRRHAMDEGIARLLIAFDNWARERW